MGRAAALSQRTTGSSSSTARGYPPNPPLERIDFEEQAAEIAELLQPGDHLVGHSYGGVISLLAAASRPALGSLTVCEPPAFGVARGDPAVEDFLARFPAAPRDPGATSNSSYRSLAARSTCPIRCRPASKPVRVQRWSSARPTKRRFRSRF